MTSTICAVGKLKRLGYRIMMESGIDWREKKKKVSPNIVTGLHATSYVLNTCVPVL